MRPTTVSNPVDLFFYDALQKFDELEQEEDMHYISHLLINRDASSD
jgi:hypothetical protein